MDRKSFLGTAVLGLAGLGVSPFVLKGKTLDVDTTPRSPADPLPRDLVEAFVRAGHADLDQTQKLLAETPTLLYASYDWGAGDFEEAIEGAGHLGNREIAEFLLGKGARVNLFLLTMLGKTDLVKSLLAEFPALLKSCGAHGFTLLHHAKVGGDAAADLYAHLLSLGLTDTHVPLGS